MLLEAGREVRATALVGGRGSGAASGKLELLEIVDADGALLAARALAYADAWSWSVRTGDRIAFTAPVVRYRPHQDRPAVENRLGGLRDVRIIAHGPVPRQVTGGGRRGGHHEQHDRPRHWLEQHEAEQDSRDDLLERQLQVDVST